MPQPLWCTSLPQICPLLHQPTTRCALRALAAWSSARDSLACQRCAMRQQQSDACSGQPSRTTTVRWAPRALRGLLCSGLKGCCQDASDRSYKQQGRSIAPLSCQRQPLSSLPTHTHRRRQLRAAAPDRRASPAAATTPRGDTPPACQHRSLAAQGGAAMAISPCLSSCSHALIRAATAPAGQRQGLSGQLQHHGGGAPRRRKRHLRLEAQQPGGLDFATVSALHGRVGPLGRWRGDRAGACVRCAQARGLDLLREAQPTPLPCTSSCPHLQGPVP